MLCHEYKCIFVHIPKTAGQSIEHVFLDLLGFTWETRAPLLLKPNDDPSLGPPALAHLKASEYVTCGHISQELFESYFKFAFVRNPWDKIVSEYKYQGYPKKFDFKTYLFKHLPKSGWTDAYVHIIPQYDFLFDAEENHLVDFIGKFERLQEDFGEICRMLDIRETSLPHINKSLSENRIKHFKKLRHLWNSKKKRENIFQHYSEYYDNESKEFVSHIYKKDIEAFNYEFGEP